MLTYAIANASTSAQSANMLIFRTDVRPVDMSGPIAWVPDDGAIADSTAIRWSGLGATGRIAPGASVAGLTARVVGLIDIAPYRVRGYARAPSLEDIDNNDSNPPSVWIDAVPGMTLGVARVPPDVTPAQLVARLSVLLRRACDLRWVDSSDICNSLGEKLEAAARSLAGDDAVGARRELAAFENDVAARAATMTREGVALLSLNVRTVQRRL